MRLESEQTQSTWYFAASSGPSSMAATLPDGLNNGLVTMKPVPSFEFGWLIVLQRVARRQHEMSVRQ